MGVDSNNSFIQYFIKNRSIAIPVTQTRILDDKKTSSASNNITTQPKQDEIVLSNKIEQNSFFKKHWGILLATSISLGGIIAFRRKIVNSIIDIIENLRPQKTPKPLEGIVDDTLKQAEEIVSERLKKINFRNLDIKELLELKKFANKEDLDKVMGHIVDYYTYVEKKPSLNAISHIEPFIEECLKSKSLSYEQIKCTCYLSKAYNELVSPQKAYEVLNKAKNIAPDEFNIYSHLIDLYSKNGQHELAIKEWELGKSYLYKGCRMEPDCFPSVIKSYTEIGDIDSVIKVFNSHGSFYNSKTGEKYAEILNNAGRHKDLIQSIFGRRKKGDTDVAELLAKHLEKLGLSADKKEKISDIVKLIEFEKGVYSLEKKDDKTKLFEKFKGIIELNKKLKGTVIPSDYADETIKRAEAAMKNIDNLEELEKIIFYSLEKRHPIAKWLEDNILNG